MSGVYRVNPGDQFHVLVGRGGGTACNDNSERGGSGAFPGGGHGTRGDSTPGGGGGYSGVFKKDPASDGFT